MTAEVQTSPEQAFLDNLLALGTDRLFVHIQLDRLNVDERYQRVVNMERVRKLAANYDPDLMGVLVCSVRPEGIFVIDGQHRLEMARLLDHETVRCELRVGLTLEQEANIFYNLDTKRLALNSDDAFRALLVAQDPQALRVRGAVEASGFKVAYGPVLDGIRCFKTLLAVENRYGASSLTNALTVLHGAWPGTVNAGPANLVEGMCYFLDKYPDINLKELSRALGAHTTSNKLTLEGRTLSGSLSWATKHSTARAIFNAYNLHRSANRLEDRL